MPSPVRLRRLATPAGSMVMLALDHGVSMGPLPGLADVGALLGRVAGAGATCVTVHKGLVPAAAAHAAGMGVMLHLSASTDGAPDPHDKRLVAGVEEAVRLGCDGVSVHVNVGSATEARQLEDVGRVSGQCAQWGMPLVAMMYPRGPAVRDPHDARLVAHAARLGAELGADWVKVPYTGSAVAMRPVVEGCPVPVVVAGGNVRDPEAFLRDLGEARKAGARGVSVGRNVFQAADPAGALRRIAEVFP